MGIILGRKGAIYLAQYGAGATAFTKEAMTANVAKTVFTIDAAAKRFWDPDTAVLVYYNDIADVTYATIQRPGGVVTWTITPGNEAVTASGKYIDLAEVGECRSWSMDVSYDFVDVTDFGSTFRKQTGIMRNATVSIEAFYVDDKIFTEMMSVNETVGFDLFLDDTPASEVRYTGYGTIASVNPSAAVDGLVMCPFTISVFDGPYFVAGLA